MGSLMSRMAEMTQKLDWRAGRCTWMMGDFISPVDLLGLIVVHHDQSKVYSCIIIRSISSHSCDRPPCSN